MLKLVCFFRKRPDMTSEEFMDYYENQHSQIGKRLGKPTLPKAIRYVRRYLKPVPNAMAGEVIDPGYDCIMEIWWKSREDFEESQRLMSDPDRVAFTIEDEKKLFATHDNPICFVEEFDSPMEPGETIYDWVPVPRT